MLDVLHTLSLALLSLNSCLDPLIYCFSVRCFCQDCWALSCLPGVGRSGAHLASLVSSQRAPWPAACFTPATLPVASWVVKALCKDLDSNPDAATY